MATADLRTLARLPLRVHANANFYLDNSGNLYDFEGTTLQTRRWRCSPTASSAAGCVSRWASTRRWRVCRVPLRPFAEYHAEIITASRDPAFSMLPGPKNRDQHWLTLGLRGRVAPGLTLDAGMDIGLRSVGFEYGTPIAPWAVIFGLSYALDLEALSRPVVVTKTVETAVPATTGTVAGAVKATDGKPVGDAVVAFGTRPRSRVVTDADGGFESGPLAAGADRGRGLGGGVRSGQDHGGRCGRRLRSRSRWPWSGRWRPGTCAGRSPTAADAGWGPRYASAGRPPIEAHADATGVFSAALPVGPYKVVVEAPGFPNKEVPLDIVAGHDKQLEVALRPSEPGRGPDQPTTVVLKIPIKFRPGAPKLDANIKAELDGVADLLLDHPEVKTLRIEAHWNGSGPGSKKKGTADVAKKLTIRQANTVRDYLIAKGAPGRRIEAVGRGSELPLVPNLGPASQIKNRRVDLRRRAVDASGTGPPGGRGRRWL